VNAVPPHDLTAEQAIIGCLIECPDHLEEVSASLCYDLRNSKLIEAMQQMVRDGQLITVVSVSISAKKLNVPQEFISQCLDQAVAATMFEHWKEVLLDLKSKRDGIMAATDFALKAATSNGNYPELVSELEAALANVESEIKPITSLEATHRMVDDLQRRFDLQGKRSGITTGYHEFDELTDGLQFGEQTVIAARPSAGKTALALNIIRRACLIDQVPTLFVTLEMSIESLCKRLLSMAENIPMHILRNGLFTQEHFAKFTRFNAELKKAPLHWINAIDGKQAIGELCAAIRRMCRKNGVKLVCVDYLQKIKPGQKHEKRTYEVGQVSGTLKATADKTKAAFLTIAQLNRESDKEKGRPPRLADLADSSQIERDADTVALIHRDWKSEHGRECGLIVAKQRDGATGLVPLIFDGQFCKFTERKKDEHN